MALRGGRLSASLTLAVRPQQTREEVAAAVAAAIAGVAAAPAAAPPGAPRYQRTGPDAAHWREAVARALGEIAAGRYRKAVLALQARCHAPAPHDVAATLTALAERFGDCFVFGYRLGDSSWVGASPELLVSLERGRLRALSLAGTSARGATDAEDEALAGALIASEKERNEHGLVVKAAREALAPLARDLSVPDAPRLLRMAGIQHLQTPIEGRAATGVDVLDALLAMHPTPAVGGAPREPALEAIARLEGMDRGWYAGPIGWMDMNGEGAFAVALRSALLHGREALLYAGAGIVAGSDPRPRAGRGRAEAATAPRGAARGVARDRRRQHRRRPRLRRGPCPQRRARRLRDARFAFDAPHRRPRRAGRDPPLAPPRRALVRVLRAGAGARERRARGARLHLRHRRRQLPPRRRRGGPVARPPHRLHRRPAPCACATWARPRPSTRPGCTASACATSATCPRRARRMRLTRSSPGPRARAVGAALGPLPGPVPPQPPLRRAP